MQITNIRFSYATADTKKPALYYNRNTQRYHITGYLPKEDIYKGREVAFFSVQFDNSLVIHRFRLLKLADDRYNLILPNLNLTVIEDKESKHQEAIESSKPMVWLTNKTLLHQLEVLSTEMYLDLVDEYQGYYERSKNLDHKNVTVSNVIKRLGTKYTQL